MAGGKRKAAETDASSKADARSAKSAKVDSKALKPSSKPAPKSKSTKRPTLTAEAFKQAAPSLHLHLTLTPPASIPEANGEEGAAPPNKFTDSEPIASLSVPPTVFSTGSYGWKGQQRVNIELNNPETGEKEAVNVTININATVLGSKPSAKDKAKKKTEKEVVKNDESEDIEEEDEDE